MKLSVEISLYPLADDFIPPINAVIERFNQYPEIDVETSYTSTCLYGDYDSVMAVLQKEIKTSFELYGRSVFVAKFLGRDVREPWV